MNKGLLSIVVPCYNEEQVLEMFYNSLKEVLDKIEYQYEIIFIDDGSKDKTLDAIKALRQKDSRIQLISFSRNFGKEAGMYAGLNYSRGDLVVIMDADLQHSPKVIPEMLKGIEEGYDTVTTIRTNRDGDPLIKSFLSRQFYKLIKRIIDIEIVQGSQDFRMMKRPVVDAILAVREYNRFSKGIFNWVGFKVKYLEVENQGRAAGNTKWNLWGLFKYSLEGILAFSTVPLRFATALGLIISVSAFALLAEITVQTLVYGKDVPGYASTIVVVLFMGAIQLLALGIIAEYISKMYMEIKSRPKYIVREHSLSKEE